MIKKVPPIRKSRLEELIEEGASVWNKEYGEIELDPETCEIYEVKGRYTKQHMGWILKFKNGEVDIKDLKERR